MNNKRAMYMLAVFCVMFITLIGYMTYTEVKYSKKHNESVHNPRVIAKAKTTVRGSVYDKNGIELAYSEKVEGEFKRCYPYENLYSHVIGYVNKDNSNSAMIESAYNIELLGQNTNGISELLNAVNKDDSKGNDLFLTIDHELQLAAYESLGSNDGAIVAINVKTGEVLALVSKPDFNPSETINVSELKNSELVPRATSGTYPPGSTFKIITTASIIDNNLDDETYDDDTGIYKLKKDNGEDFECKNTEGEYKYYFTDLEKAFTVSSNVYFAHLSTMLDIADLRKTSEAFKFNKKLDFDLPLAQSTFSKSNLSAVPKYNSFIGQGETLATPFHMALVGATIANGGIMPKPYLVSEIKSGSSSVSKTKASDMGRVISEKTANQIKDYMKSVVASDNGTGTAARIPGMDVCGKTGTSTKEVTINGENVTLNHALFVGFAPYDDPEIAVCVVVENGGSGGRVAAPIAGTVMKKYFSLN